MDYIEHYKRDALEFDYWGKNQFTPSETRRMQTVYDLCGDLKGLVILDIGSGRGWFSLYAIKQGAKVVALDLSEENLHKIKALDERIETMFGDACDIVITERRFDLIVALEVLEHLVEPKIALKNWLKLLKPDGRLIITVPYKEVINYTLCIHCHQKTPHNAHLHSFDQDTLIKLLTKNGYWVKRVHFFLHKLLTHLRLDKALDKLPYSWWKLLDKICRITGKNYSYIALVATPTHK